MATAPPPLSRRERSEQTRARILATARELLATRPYSEFTVAAVMEAVGLTRPAFYKHFADLPDLVAAIMLEVAEEMQAIGRAWDRALTVGPATAERHLAEVVDIFADNIALLRALAEAARQDPALSRQRHRYIELLTEEMVAALDQRITDGDLSPMNTREISRAMVIMIEGYLLQALGDPDPVDREVALETIWLLWSRTIHDQPDRPRRAAGRRRRS